jgi:hypothetical protein
MQHQLQNIATFFFFISPAPGNVGPILHILYGTTQHIKNSYAFIVGKSEDIFTFTRIFACSYNARKFSLNCDVILRLSSQQRKIHSLISRVLNPRAGLDFYPRFIFVFNIGQKS